MKKIKKAESTLLNMVLALVLITLFSGMALGYVNEITKGPKEATRLKRKLAAIQSVLPEITNNPAEKAFKLPVTGSTDSLEFYLGFNEKDWSGVAVSTFTKKGFSGLIRMMVGIGSDGNVHNVVVLEQKETPGLGTKIKDSKYIGQYIGKSPGNFNFEVEKDGGEVDAITGATISSRAFSDATLLAFDVYEKNKKLIEERIKQLQ